MVQAGYLGFLVVNEERRLVALSAVPSEVFGDYLFVRPELAVPPHASSGDPV